MTGFAANPDHLRAAAARLADLAGRAGEARRASVAGEGSPTAAEFPQADVGQRAGKIWDDARPVFTSGLDLIQRMLSDTSTNFTSAAAAYEATDTASADRIGKLS